MVIDMSSVEEALTDVAIVFIQVEGWSIGC